MTRSARWWDTQDPHEGWRSATVLAPTAAAEVTVQENDGAGVNVTLLLPRKEAQLTVEAARDLRDALDHALGLAAEATA